MGDRYQQVVNSPIGKQLAETLGLPVPVRLRRYEPGQPILHGPVRRGDAPGGKLGDAIGQVLRAIGADELAEETDGKGVAAHIFDASGITDSSQLRALYDFFHPDVKRTAASGRVIILGQPPHDLDDPRHAAAQRALEGFSRSLAKEMRRGATVNLVHVAEGAEGGLDSTLRFLLSGRSAFVNAQVIRITPTDDTPTIPTDWDRPLEGQVALVTGAAQGIGASIAEVLGRDGAHVICLDIPPQGDKLAEVANRVGGSSLQLDITSDDAPRRLAEHVRSRHGALDIMVHNAGITRDKTLAGMDADQWDAVLAVNLTSQEALNDVLLGDDGILNEGGRIVSVSSLSGIAGNRGQTNYAASKAGVIGMVEALERPVGERGGTINAVAPGFIETAMTGEMPIAVREAGRRMNSLNQGGLPEDVAETIAWLANPASAMVNGNVVRVCGQALLGK
jgi:3-oxoacyl-[acyl-carrier protein] reductase